MKITKTAEVDKIENKQQQQRNYVKQRAGSLKKINKNWQIYGNSDRVKREKTQITNIRNEAGSRASLSSHTMKWIIWIALSVQFSSVQLLSCVWLCDPMNCSTPGLPVHHQLLEFTQTHVYWVSDAIQPSHLLSSPSPPAPNPSQHQGLFQWVNFWHELAKVSEFQL